MKSEVDEKTRLLILCWRKHHIDDSTIGWDELTEELCDGLSRILGNEEYYKLQKKYMDNGPFKGENRE